MDLGILDVMQIFGRAGRPQFDTFGHGTILTTHDKLSHYLSLGTRQNPIESQFISVSSQAYRGILDLSWWEIHLQDWLFQSLTDNLNAEVALGSVDNISEAVKWLSYTYLMVRMRQNPLVYGITYNTLKVQWPSFSWSLIHILFHDHIFPHCTCVPSYHFFASQFILALLFFSSDSCGASLLLVYVLVPLGESFLLLVFINLKLGFQRREDLK